MMQYKIQSILDDKRTDVMYTAYFKHKDICGMVDTYIIYAIFISSKFSAILS